MVPKIQNVKKLAHVKKNIRPLQDFKRRPRLHGEANYQLRNPIVCLHAFRLICIYTNEQTLGIGTIQFPRKIKQHVPPGHDASTAEAAPGRADKVRVGEYDKEVSDREMNLIVFPRKNSPKVRLRKAEERSQRIANDIPLEAQLLQAFPRGYSKSVCVRLQGWSYIYPCIPLRPKIQRVFRH